MGTYTVVAEYPAYKVLAGTEKRFYAPGDVMRIDGNTFELSDVMSYALSHGECPFAAHQSASANRHQLYFAVPLSTSLSSSATKQKVVFAQNFGDVITYAGKKFKLVKANNNNVRMVEVEVEVK